MKDKIHDKKVALKTFNLNQTNKIINRYQRLAPFYNFVEIIPEKFYRPMRRHLWSLIDGPKVLEIGVGTGKNFKYHPRNLDFTGIDFSSGMLKRARKHAASIDSKIKLSLGDVQMLEFPDKTFDAVVATFVFCSVPNPLLGLSEIKRVLKPNGKIYLLEHVKSNNSYLGALMDIINPLVVGTIGVNINRRTISNVKKVGFRVIKDDHLGMGDIFRLIIAVCNED